MNTAPLTGVPRRVPVRLVTVDSGGALVEVTEHISCESANAQVLQVSGTCPAHVSPRLCAGMYTQLSSSPIPVPTRQLRDPGNLSDPRPPLRPCHVHRCAGE